MDKFLEFIVDNVGTFLFMAFAGVFIWLMFSMVESSNQARENTRRLTEACYSQGLVLVSTDAGQRCVDPRTLVKVK